MQNKINTKLVVGPQLS